MTPLRQQMTDAMVLRGFALRTQEAYLAAVVALAKFYRRPPDTLTAEQLQAYLLHLIREKKLAYSSVNQACCAFRFLFGSVLRQADVRFDIPPHDLNGLIGWCPRVIYETLFGAVSATLTEFAANPRWLGGLPAFSLVLHTWKQDLGRHVHVHALMAGGALSATGDWKTPKRGFLFPVKALSKVFRGKFVAALNMARDNGKLQGPGLADEPWRDLIARLHAHDWVVYAKQPLGGPVQVLEYLGRYTHRVAISNERIVGMDEDSVSLRVRDWAQGNRRRTLRLPAQSFIERFLLHVLPKGFKRIRHYGLLGPAGKAVKLARARAALSVPAPDPVVVESVAAFMCRIDRHAWARCGHCGQGCFVPTAPIPVSKGHLLQPRGPP